MIDSSVTKDTIEIVKTKKIKKTNITSEEVNLNRNKSCRISKNIAFIWYEGATNEEMETLLNYLNSKKKFKNPPKKALLINTINCKGILITLKNLDNYLTPNSLDFENLKAKIYFKNDDFIKNILDSENDEASTLKDNKVLIDQSQIIANKTIHPHRVSYKCCKNLKKEITLLKSYIKNLEERFDEFESKFIIITLEKSNTAQKINKLNDINSKKTSPVKEFGLKNIYTSHRSIKDDDKKISLMENSFDSIKELRDNLAPKNYIIRNPPILNNLFKNT